MNKDLMFRVADAVLAAAKAIVAETSNLKDDQVLLVVEAIYGALKGAFAASSNLPTEVVAKCFDAASSIESEYLKDA